MKRLILFSLFLVAIASQAQLEQCTHEVYYSDDGTVSGYPLGYTTYRIYLDLEDPADAVSAIYAAGNDLMTIGSQSNTIWNSAFGAVTGDAINELLFGAFPSTQYDSFVTIGRATSSDPGNAITAISTLPDQFVFQTAFGADGGLDEVDENLFVSDGAVFTPAGGVNSLGIDQGGPGPYRVLIAQITSDGDLEYQINAQIFDESDGQNALMYVGDPETVDGADINGFPLGLTYPNVFFNCNDPLACNYNNLPDEEDDPAACEYDSCAGCTDELACNYDPAATIDDGSCQLPDGCTDDDADNYDPDALCDDGSCMYLGCTDPGSCNYDEDATDDDGSCTDTCPGCTDPLALNYDPNATVDDGSCTDNPVVDTFLEVVTVHTEPTEDGEDLTGMTTYRLYVELVGQEHMVASIFGVEETPLFINSTEPYWQSAFGSHSGAQIQTPLFPVFPSLEYDSWITVGMESADDDGAVYTAEDPDNPWIAPFESGESISIVDDPIGGTWFTTLLETNGFPDDDNRVLLGQFTTAGDIAYCFGIQIFLNGDGQQEVQATLCGGAFTEEGCTDPTACNYQPWYTIDDGSCILPDGCTDDTAVNYDADAQCEDGSCLYGGCLDDTACNYDPEADVDDGSCILPDGCTNPWADNYDPDALCDDGSCTCTDGELVSLAMFDSFGDGWNGTIWTVSDVDNNELFSGTLEQGTTEVTWFCLADGCYYFETEGGAFPSETSWTLEGSFGVLEGSSPEQAVFSIGDDCVVGCQDPSSCNYIEDADISFGCDYSCIGCTDPAACNYEDDNTIDDGGCLYYAIIQGYVFNDANQDGFFDTWDFGEPGLANIPVLIEELGITTYTNDDGYFEFFNVPNGTYTISLPNIPEGWVTTTPESLSVTTSECLVEDIVFGLVGEDSPPFWVSGPCCIFMMDIHCDWGFNPGLWVHNTGSTPLNGTITVAYDEVLEAETLWGAEPPTTIEPGLSTWELVDSPLGGQDLIYQIHILGPGVDYVGQEFPIDITLSLVDDEGVEYYNNTWTLYPIVVCAYDPNDKYAEDDGYTEEHFILAEDEIEYRIRFQNTGNFPATNVNIKDTLDISRLDLETFYPVFGSHSFMTCVQPDGAVEFVFDNIMLPDSAMDEPGSQGYVVYRIKSLEGIEPGEVINNTAHIFFDLNPAVVTNTTWHTIYECGDEALFEVNADAFCEGDEITASGTHPWTESYDWDVDGIDYGAEDSWTDALSTGTFDIMLTASNPLCDPVTETHTVEVNPLPVAEITEDGVVLTASAGESYQWFLDGDAIDGATDQSYTATEEGWYSVEVTNEFNCSDVSAEVFVMVTGIFGQDQHGLVVYPNPMTQSSTLLLDKAAERVEILDSRGRTIQSYDKVYNDRLIINKSDMAPGQYTVRVVFDNTTQEISLLVK